jgi:urease accessory protein
MILSDSRAAADVGRRARLHLSFDVRDGRTDLVSGYAEPPFRVPRGFRDRNAGLHAILASSAPGIFGGDDCTQIVDVACGARVRLTSQSAQQVHPSPDNGTARVEARYRVADGAHLHCAWDPGIPFASARLAQCIHIELAREATLFWSDAMMAGREARGERWAFARLAHELRIVRGGELLYLERYVIDPEGPPVTSLWIAGDACYFGTVVLVGSFGAPSPQALHDELAAMAGVSASVDRLEADVLLIRLSATSGPAFHNTRRRLARIDAREPSPGSV